MYQNLAPEDLLTEFSGILSQQRYTEAAELLDQVGVSNSVWLLAHVQTAELDTLLAKLSCEYAAEIIEDLPESTACDALGRSEAPRAAEIISNLPSDVKADLLPELEEEKVKEILSELPEEESAALKVLLTYDADTAGGLMITEYLSFEESISVKAVLDTLESQSEKYSDFEVQYVYVTSARGFLVGVLRLRDLVLSNKQTLIKEIMLDEPIFVSADESLDKLYDMFDSNNWLGLPVVDRSGKLVGVVHSRDIREAFQERSDFDRLKESGIIGDELRTMPVMGRSTKRLSWLTVNIVLNVLAASIIAFYQDTLSKAIALAVFLPIVSDMSGCTGNQAVAVSMRELALGVTKPFEVFRVLLQELKVGIIIGICLGLLLGGVAYLWQQDIWMSMVVGTSLSLNTLVAVSIGGCVPLILKKMNKDPALASGPILTTVTDMCGFFLVLSLASIWL